MTLRKGRLLGLYSELGRCRLQSVLRQELVTSIETRDVHDA